jgi:hypothetical protein
LKAYAMGYLVYKSLQPYSKDVWSLAVTLPFFLCGLTCELASSHHRLPLSQSTIVDLTCMMVSGIRLEWSEVTFLQNSHMIHFWSISDPFLIHFWSISDPFTIYNRYQQISTATPGIRGLPSRARPGARHALGARALRVPLRLSRGAGERRRQSLQGVRQGMWLKPGKTMEKLWKTPWKTHANLRIFNSLEPGIYHHLMVCSCLFGLQ